MVPKNHNRWTIRSTNWQLDDVRSAGRPNVVVEISLLATGNGVDNNSKGQTKLETSDGALLSAAEGHSQEQNRNTTSSNIGK